MIKYNINRELSKLNSETNKIYIYTYKLHGFEFGFGRKGIYTGHSHIYFYDIIFSKSEILSRDLDMKMIKGNLIVIPPQTYINEVIIDDFFFLKFCPSMDKVMIPDKTNNKLNKGVIQCFDRSVNLDFNWYKNPESSVSNINLSLSDNNLTLCISEDIFNID